MTIAPLPQTPGAALDSEPEALLPRISTGNPQADELLHGGFPANSINVVMGEPGTGKTIFAEQLVFHNARAGSDDRPVLYITTLSEPASKVVSYVQRFGFFDETLLGSRILYEDLGALLGQQGPTALVPWIKEAIKRSSPRLIVIDSFRALHDLSSSPTEIRRVVSDLAGLLSAYDTTTFLVGEYTSDAVRVYPEFAVADSIVEFAREALTSRDERFFRILKLRGSDYRQGQHAFRISGQGLQFFPRLVGPVVPVDYQLSVERVQTGVPGLDEMVDGGLWRGSTTLAIGPTGSGKTTIALQFALEGARRGEPSLIVNFQENPSQLRRAMANLGFDPSAADARHIHLRYTSPVELQIDSIIVEIFEHITRSGIRRVVIDAVGDLVAAASDPQRVHDYLYALVQHFAVNGVTSFLTFESGEVYAGASFDVPRLSYMSDNVLEIALAGEEVMRRTLRVVKTRNSAHDPRVRRFEIGSTGGRVL